MKKNVILLVIGMVFSIGAMAQTKDSKEVKTDQRNMTSTIVDKKEDKHEAGKDLAHLKVKDAYKKHKEVRRHQMTINREDERLEAHGVKHPKRKAKHMAKAEKEMKKANE